jgi:hypothetical protein
VDTLVPLKTIPTLFQGFPVGKQRASVIVRCKLVVCQGNFAK